MKYVIKNCDNYTELGKDWTCRSTIQNRKGCYVCQDCTDCVMKQIVEKCKRTLSINKGLENEFTLGKMTFAEFILKDIDIQEVE